MELQLLQCGGFFLLTPDFNFSKLRLRSRVGSTALKLVVSLVLIMGFVYLSFIQYIPQLPDNISTILFGSYFTTQLISYVVSVSYSSIFSNINWIVFWKSLNQLFNENIKKTVLTKFSLFITLANILLPIFMVLHLIVEYHAGTFATVQCFIPSYILLNLDNTLISINCIIIYKIYAHLKNINQILDSFIKHQKSLHDFQDDEFKQTKNNTINIRRAQRKYIQVTKMVNYFNSIYGYQMLLFLGKTFIICLLCLNKVIDIIRYPEKEHGAIITIFIPMIVYCHGSVMLILTCDTASSEAESTANVCYELQESFYQQSKDRQEVQNFALYAKCNKINFSAAGFFEIGKSTLFALVGTVTTYFIVLIQFNTL